MELKFFRKLIPLALGLIPVFAFASDVKIGILSQKHCVPDDFNSHVYLETKTPGDLVGQCVLTFLRESREGGALESETEALIRVNGTLIHLRRPDKTFYAFESDDGSISVTLSAEETGTSCVEGVDSCCGSDYAGSLTVKTASGKASVRVAYYRGG